MKKIAIMTAGGDCAGLNAAIKSVVMAASKNNIVVVGIIDGFIGFVERKYMVLDNKIVEMLNRNDLCWCKSGLKYKKCHMEFDGRLDKLKRKGCIVPTRDLIKTKNQKQ